MVINKRKNLFLAAALGAIIGLISFAPIWIRHGGQYVEYGDYFIQYVPFIKELKRMAASGSLAWSWNSFLGDSFIGAYSYYTVFNPFAWMVALFPDEYILYGTMFATILKLSLCTVTSVLYMKCFVKNDTYALIGALLYTFSGFTLINTYFYFYLEVIAFFPLLMYGLEKLITEGKRKIYVSALVLNAAMNYYLFVSTVLLVVIYVVFRLQLYKRSSWKTHGTTFWRITIYSIIGTGLACFALIPSFYAILGSGKASGSIGTEFELMYWPQKFLEHMRTLVAPIESAMYHAFYDSSIWSSTGVYLPVFGCICVVSWCWKKRDWLQKISITLLICYFIPVLNAAFNLFSSVTYTRWLYGMALIFSLVTVLQLEELDRIDKTFDKRVLTVYTLFGAGLLIVPSTIYILDIFGVSLLNRFASVCAASYFMGYSALYVMLILSALNYIAMWILCSKKKIVSKSGIVIIVLVCTLNFAVYNILNYDLHEYDSSYRNQEHYEKSLVEGTEAEGYNFEFRIDHPSYIRNYGLFKNAASVNYFNSLQNLKSSQFAVAIGIAYDSTDTVLLSPEDGGEYMDALLSVKYYYDYDGGSQVPDGFRYLKTENAVKIYENENYIPMGFVYDHYWLEDQLSDAESAERAELMLQAMVIQPQDEKIVSKYLSMKEDSDDVALRDVVADRKETVCSFFKGDSRGFNAEIMLERDNIVFFSIPNDKGWEITVNGEPATVIEVNYGLMGICCSAGKNVISAIYHTQGCMLGIACSTLCAVAWVCMEVYNKKTGK